MTFSRLRFLGRDRAGWKRVRGSLLTEKRAAGSWRPDNAARAHPQETQAARAAIADETVADLATIRQGSIPSLTFDDHGEIFESPVLLLDSLRTVAYRSSARGRRHADYAAL